MALRQSDILEHNNPNLAVADSDFVKGGFRSPVNDLIELYALSNKVDEPTAAGQLKEHATIVYVISENKYYELVDINNVGNSNGWKEFSLGGGGSITGVTNGLHLSNSGKVIALGGELTGDTSFSGGVLKYTTHLNFTGDTDIIDKQYVDSLVFGLRPKPAVDVATTTSLTYPFSGLTTIDNITLTTDKRVLVKDQIDKTQNGIWIVKSGLWVRADDFDGSPQGEIVSGSYVFVLSGDTNKKSSWILDTPDPIYVDVTPLNFLLFDLAREVNEGIGINITSNNGVNVISVDGENLVGNSLVWSGDTFNVDVNSGSLYTTLNGKLDKITFNNFTGTTLPNNYVSKNIYTGYTGTTNLRISNIETNYINAANNGLTKLGNTVLFGGTLTDNTCINLDTNDLMFRNSSNLNTVLHLHSNNINNWISLSTTDTGNTKCSYLNINTNCLQFEYCQDTTNQQLISLCDKTYFKSNNGWVFDTFNCSGHGLIKYANDYTSLMINPRQIPDIGYVTGITSNNLVNVCNGLTKVGKTAILGGEITGDTCIYAVNGGKNISIDFKDSEGNLYICATGGGKVNVSVNSGITYTANYSSSFVNRSLVDKEYVDNRIDVINTTIINSTPYYTTNNDRFIGVSGYSIGNNAYIYLNTNPIIGQKIIISDIQGQALTTPIYIDGNGKNINGNSTGMINTDYGSVTLIYNGSFWSAIGFVN